jgi:hypothetical protein
MKRKYIPLAKILALRLDDITNMNSIQAMQQLDISSHAMFLQEKLLTYLPEDSFASRIKNRISTEINLIFSDAEPKTVYSLRVHELFPVHLLFEWIIQDEGITIEELADEDGQLFDDSGSLVPDTVICPISGAEQMAAFGLWLIGPALDIAGPSADEDYDEHGLNPEGWYKENVRDHEAQCLLNAYQALWYAERLSHTVQLSETEKARVEQFDFSTLGKKGASVRLRPMVELRDHALSLYDPQKWKSANQAAHQMWPQIVAHGRTINAKLEPSNAQRTIAEWFRKKSV